jgi:3-deoxy-D-arabino-heptulosonate 7-phosphate (DAHP) synthase class II
MSRPQAKQMNNDSQHNQQYHKNPSGPIQRRCCIILRWRPPLVFPGQARKYRSSLTNSARKKVTNNLLDTQKRTAVIQQESTYKNRLNDFIPSMPCIIKLQPCFLTANRSNTPNLIGLKSC